MTIIYAAQSAEDHTFLAELMSEQHDNQKFNSKLPVSTRTKFYTRRPEN